MRKLSSTHSTLESSIDENGNSHRYDIDLLSHSEASYFSVYSAYCFSYGRAFGDDRDGKQRIAKFPAKSTGIKEWALVQIEISKSARKSAEHFVKNFARKVTFLTSQYASLVSVSYFDKSRNKNEFGLFEDKLTDFSHFVDSNGALVKSSLSNRTNKRISLKRQKSGSSNSFDNANIYDQAPEEIALPAVELDIPLTPSCPPYEEDPPPSYDEIFGNRNNVLPRSRPEYNYNLELNQISNLPYFPIRFYDRYHPSVVPSEYIQPTLQTTNSVHDDEGEEEDDKSHPILRAFVHFDFWQANGQRVICNLKGTSDDRGNYTLTTPVIHSLKKTYGNRDLGQIGMLKVIENHVCTKRCRHLPSMRNTFEEARAAF